MTRTATLSVRVDNDAKVAADQTLNEIGVSMSSVINVLIKKIAREKRVPFSFDLPQENTLADISDWTNEQILSMVNEEITATKREDYMLFDKYKQGFNWNNK